MVAGAGNSVSLRRSPSGAGRGAAIGDLADFLRGVFVGAAIAVPVGPVNLLTLRRTLAYGRRSGVATGLGAGIADTLYGAIAAFGLTLISDFLIAQQTWLRIGGGGFLVFMGLRALRPHLSPKLASDQRPTFFHAALSSFLLTLSNPVTILAFGAVFGAVGVVDPDLRRLDATLLVGGVFTGSMSWWLLITALVGRVRARTSPLLVQRLSQASGVLIAIFGIVLVATAIPVW